MVVMAAATAAAWAAWATWASKEALWPPITLLANHGQARVRLAKWATWASKSGARQSKKYEKPRSDPGLFLLGGPAI